MKQKKTATVSLVIILILLVLIGVAALYYRRLTERAAECAEQNTCDIIKDELLDDDVDDLY